jgi:hypothetical protein
MEELPDLVRLVQKKVVGVEIAVKGEVGVRDAGG